MKRIPSKKLEYVFIWPDNEDADFILPETMKKTLYRPKQMRRGRFTFDKKYFENFKLVK